MSQLDIAVRELIVAWDCDADLAIAISDLKAALAQQEKPEPVVWMSGNEDCTDCLTWIKTEENTIPLYTQPPRREWVELTDEQIEGLHSSFVLSNFFSKSECDAYMQGARDAETKLKELNT